MTAKSNRIIMAKVTAPHGIRGLVKILFYGDDIRLLEQNSVYTSAEGNKTVKLKIKNPAGRYYLVQIDGADTREDAGAYKGTELYLDRAALPDIEDEGTFYYEDLIGLSAVNEDGEPVGTVVAVHNFGAGDLLDIKPVTGETFLLPFTDEYVPEVHDDRVIVRPLSEMI